MEKTQKDIQYYKFCAYGFFKNLKFFDAFLMLFFLEKGIGYGQIGILYAVREVSINLLEIPSGLLADMYGRKRAMIFSFFSYIISFLMFYFVHQIAGFILAFIFYGVGDAFRTGTHKAMILDYLNHKGWVQYKTAYYGLTRSWSQRGAAIAALISALLVFYTGTYKYVFLISVVPYLIDLLLMLSYPSFLNGDRIMQKRAMSLHLQEYIISLKKSFGSWRSFEAIISTSSYTGYYKATKDYLQPLLVSLAAVLPLLTAFEEERKVAVVIGVIYSFLYFLNAFVSQRSYVFEALFKQSSTALSVVQLAGWLGGLMAGILFVRGLELPSIVCFILILVVQNIRRPLAVKYISDQFDNKVMATVLSVESQSETFFSALFVVLLGYMIENWGVGVGVIVLSAGLILLNRIVKLSKRWKTL